MREAIIGAIINQLVPAEYYDYEASKWLTLKTAVDDFLQKCATASSNTGSYSNVKCIQTAGRTHSYDFSIQFTYGDDNDNDVDGHPPPPTTTIHKVEFKYNAKKVSDTPQFVSPMKPSQYLSSCYEEYFYDNYLTKIAVEALPPRDEWLKQIHNTSPVCLQTHPTILRFTDYVRSMRVKAFKPSSPPPTLILKNFQSISVSRSVIKSICCIHRAME
jgi:hypothetical protein